MYNRFFSSFWEDASNSLTRFMVNKPDEWETLQSTYFQKFYDIVTSTLTATPGAQIPEILSPEKGDRRFNDPDWNLHPLFSYLKQVYLLNAQYWQKIAQADIEGEGGDPLKTQFILKNLFEAIAPTNFPWSNPEVLKATLDQQGENLRRGFENFIKDQKNPQTWGLPAMTTFSHFKVGKNLATTPGWVIFENEICQLIAYTPIKPNVYARPLLIIPPWINKFYILDLSERNSFVRWNLEQGRQVFLISWVNPDARYKNLTFFDYISQGIDQCVDFVRNVTQQETINLLGFCVSGVAVLSLLSLYAQKAENKIQTTTLLATPVDFEHLKEFSALVNPAEILRLEAEVEKQGIITGESMVRMFAFLRANDLIWSNYVNNYLLGKNPPPLDFLFWNNDPVNLPGRLHLDYLRAFFLENAFMRRSLILQDIPIHLESIKTPLFAIATQNDHIVPWKSLYALRSKCPQTHFVLGGSGHIAGIINPPSQEKYGYRTSTASPKASSQEWLDGAVLNPGSWWTLWNTWIQEFDGNLVPSQEISESKRLEPAPGRYVTGVHS